MDCDPASLWSGGRTRHRCLKSGPRGRCAAAPGSASGRRSIGECGLQVYNPAEAAPTGAPRPNHLRKPCDGSCHNCHKRDRRTRSDQAAGSSRRFWPAASMRRRPSRDAPSAPGRLIRRTRRSWASGRSARRRYSYADPPCMTACSGASWSSSTRARRKNAPAFMCGKAAVRSPQANTHTSSFYSARPSASPARLEEPTARAKTERQRHRGDCGGHPRCHDSRRRCRNCTPGAGEGSGLEWQPSRTSMNSDGDRCSHTPAA
jgi:hypothetical protein